MSKRLCCCPAPQPLQIKRQTLLLFAMMLGGLVCVPSARASSDAPAWMHALVNVPLPPHDEKTNAVLLYSEQRVNVVSADRIDTHVRKVYKIVRPDGRDRGVAEIPFNPQTKIKGLRGWCIPAQGKDYEVKDKDAYEVSLPKIEGSNLIDDVKVKLLQIPAADPGNIVGYEYDVEEQPLVLQDIWEIQEESPAHESHYSVSLPRGWEYKASFINYPETKPTQTGDELEWVVQDVKGVRPEVDMPPFRGVAGHMIITFFPPGGRTTSVFANWKEMGDWYANLTSGRRDASPEIKQKVAALTASVPAPLDKMKAIADFMQHDIRYVSIQLGIGGWQPHPATDIFVHRYGDCKDKATLMSSMLHEIGVESYYVVVNAERGAVTREMPAYAYAFDHAILAIKLPGSLSDPSLVATIEHPTLGRLLFFDPTNEFTPFGQIGGYLQSNFGLLVAPAGGELVMLPQSAAAGNSVQRTASFTLTSTGALKGDVREVRIGDRAVSQRAALHSVTRDSDKIKPIESMLAESLSNFTIVKASVVNLQQNDQPFEYHYSFTADNYTKNAGNLLAIRPRVLGTKTRGLLETKEPRMFPVEFRGPAKDTDIFEITLPLGLEVDELPPPVDVDFSFASYHSKSEVVGNLIRYTRTFEIKELSVPASRAAELKKFYRIINGDERNTALLRLASH